MAEDSTSTASLGGNPETDTLDEQQGDTGENTQQAQQPGDEPAADSPRYREIQAAYTRSQQTLRDRENEIIRLRQQAQPIQQSSSTDPLADRERRLAERERQLQSEQEWAEVQRRYPPEVVEAYREASRNWQLDPSPLGAINGFVAGVRVLGERAKPAAVPTTAAPARRDAVKPRVDTSRSEAPDPAAIDKEIAGAKERGDLKGGVAALFKRAALTSK